jgi:uncharacterized membrane protein YgcG
LLLITALGQTAPAHAEVRVVNASGEYRMGDRDTREDAVRLATEAAKRNALEQVATYLESITVVDGMDVTKDEIRTYTAGLVLVLEQQSATTLDGDTIVVNTDLVAQIDTEEVVQAIAALRENEDARQQLVVLKEENELLQQDLDAANQALVNASTADQAQQASQQRQDILNRVQSNAMVSQAWTDWVLVSPVVSPNLWAGLAQTHALLNVARNLYPTSPHVTAAQQVITTRQPPVPPQPAPPASTALPSIPRQIVPNPGSLAPPRTLNEITHTTPTAPAQIGSQFGSRTLTDARQVNPLNPMLPPGSGQQQSRSMRRMQQFLQPNGGFGQPPGSVPRNQSPGARRLPPPINQIHPPLPHQVPSVPYQMAPRSFGGGSPGGGLGRGGGSGGRSGGGGGGGRGGGRGR